MSKPRSRIVATWLWRRGGWLMPASILAGLMVIVTYHEASTGFVSAGLLFAVALPALAAGSHDPMKLGVSRRLGSTWRDHFYGSRIVLLAALSPIVLAAVIWKLRRTDGVFATVHLVMGLLVCASLFYDLAAVFRRKSLFARVQFPLILAIIAFLQPAWWGSGVFAWMALALVATVTVLFSLAVTAEHWRATTKERPQDYRIADFPRSHWLFIALFLFSVFGHPRHFGDRAELAHSFLIGGLLLGLLLLLVESLRSLRGPGRRGGTAAAQ